MNKTPSDIPRRINMNLRKFFILCFSLIVITTLNIYGCKFIENTSSFGGGIRLSGYYSISPFNAYVDNCEFYRNVATSSKGGAGIHSGGGEPIIRNCLFNENTGGGISCNSENNLTIENCEFFDNTSVDGGGISVRQCLADIVNCLFVGNSASAKGGGVYVWWTNLLIINNIKNCTFIHNTANQDGNDIACEVNSSLTITDSLFWNLNENISQQISIRSSLQPSQVTISYSDIKGNISSIDKDNGCTLTWGNENIDADPQFTMGPNGDYYLSQSSSGQIINSPCVDKGSALSSALGLFEYTTRTDEVNDTGIVDMGYHYPTPSPPSNDECSGAEIIMKNTIYYGTTITATGSFTSSCGVNDSKDLWFVFDPPEDKYYRISLCGSEFDTTLSLFNACDSAEVLCNDNLCDTQSEIVEQLVSGSSYYIRISGNNGESGEFQLLVSDPICINEPATDANNDCIVNLLDYAILTLEWLSCGYDIQDACL